MIRDIIDYGKLNRKKADYRRHADFEKRFNEELRSLEKIIRDAKIVGDTLSVARSKVDVNIIIRPYETTGIHLEDNRSNRCNVAMDGCVISKIVSFG